MLSPDRDRTVVVTGIGIISAAGATPQAVWERVAGGNSPAVAFTDPLVADSPSIPAAVVPNLSAETTRARRSHKMDRCVQLGLEAAAQAFADAQLQMQPIDTNRLGIVAGTSRGPAQKWTELIDLIRGGCRRLPPTLAAHSTIACLSGALAMAFEAGGPCWTTSATCASAAHAIAQAAQQILLGTADVMLAGGAEAPLQDSLIRQLLSTGILGARRPGPGLSTVRCHAQRDAAG